MVYLTNGGDNMVFDYVRKVEEEVDWLRKEKERHDITLPETIAVVAVMNDLTTGFNEAEAIECCDNTLSDSSGEGYFSGNSYYSNDDIKRVYLDSRIMVLSHIYITQNNNIVVVAVSPDVEDIFGSEEGISSACEDAEPIYFVVEY
jgi:hypothetical protein